jgi:hypothetical protein
LSRLHSDGSASHSDGFDNHSDGSAHHLDSFDNHLDGSASHLDDFDNHLDDFACHLDASDSHLDCFASLLDDFIHSSTEIYCLLDRFDNNLEFRNYKIDSAEQAPAPILSYQGTCHKHTGKTRNPNLRQEPCQPSHATAPINGSTSIEHFNTV